MIPELSSSPHTILIVDDDPDVGMALTDLLTSEGHHVEVVETGSAALRYVTHLHVDTVILDVGLPDTDGLAVLQAMHEHRPQLPVILVTAHAALDRSLGPLDLHGAFAYLTKPYHGEEIKSTVRRALGLSALASRTERIQRALGRSELRFRSMMESSPDAIVLANQTGTITNWNRAAAQQFGYTEAEVIGKPLTMLMPPRYRDAHQRALSRFESIEQASIIRKTLELEGMRRDGSTFPIELSLGSWLTDEGVFFSGIIRDVSQRKRIERALQHRNAMERTMTMVARKLFHASIEDLDSAITAALAMIGDVLSADRASISCFTDDGGTITTTYAWRSPDTPVGSGQDHITPIESLPWLMDQIVQGTRIHLPTLSSLPPEAALERATLQAERVHSLLSVPLVGNGKAIGYLRIDAIHRTTDWNDDDTQSLVVIAEMIVSAMERKRRELVHREREERLQRLAETMNVLPWEADYPSDRITYIGPQARTLFGYDQEEWYRERFRADHIHPDDRDRVVSHCREAAQRRSEYEIEYRLYTADGRTVWVHDLVHVRRDRDGQPRTLSGFLIDITRRRQAQETRQATPRALGAFLANLPLPVLILDHETRVLYANPPAQREFSREGPLVGMALRERLPLTSDQWADMNVHLGAFDDPETVLGRQGEFQVQGRAFRYQLFRVALPFNHLDGIGLALWEMTDHHALRDQLIHSQRLSGLGALVSGMAHEMSNPLQAILGLTELLAEETDPDVGREMARDLHRVGGHVTAILRDLMAYVRPTAHSLEEQLDVNERLLKAVSMVQRGPYFGQVHLVTAFHDRLPTITARQAEIDQVFINLIMNAVQAMSGRGQLTLTTEATASTIRIRIEDTGTGIAPDKLDKIFEPFFTTKPPGHGTGLGLGIVHTIVGKYRGTIAVASQVDHGTVFTLEFPVTTRQPDSGRTGG